MFFVFVRYCFAFPSFKVFVSFRLSLQPRSSANIINNFFLCVNWVSFTRATAKINSSNFVRPKWTINDDTRSYYFILVVVCLFEQVRESFALNWCWNRFILAKDVNRLYVHVMRYFLNNLGAIWQAAATGNNVPQHNLYCGMFRAALDFGFRNFGQFGLCHYTMEL